MSNIKLIAKRRKKAFKLIAIVVTTFPVIGHALDTYYKCIDDSDKAGYDQFIDEVKTFVKMIPFVLVLLLSSCDYYTEPYDPCSNGAAQCTSISYQWYMCQQNESGIYTIFQGTVDTNTVDVCHGNLTEWLDDYDQEWRNDYYSGNSQKQEFMDANPSYVLCVEY